MPLLSREMVDLVLATKGQCASCNQMVRRNYCRTCDEFTWEFHAENCPERSEHIGHRGYDEHSPVVGDALRGYEWEAAHGRYRIR